jgi:hypothetical protein
MKIWKKNMTEWIEDQRAHTKIGDENKEFKAKITLMKS